MTTDKKRIRRNHTPELKAQIIAECEVPGASVAKVAMAHGINANIVHGWRKLAREQGVAQVVGPAFVPLAIPASAVVDKEIHVELRRGALTMTVAWPSSAAAEMTSWMRELLR
ncbi:transposase [Ideonella sp. B508-1]|uniref:IS66-like element accessory protein TnpA n=1 Tax=Ideonella sp. B508-1 TaxID=137716 RepID=UPI00034AAB2E|nr:transposase [Ideonella sp. B508-1]